MTYDPNTEVGPEVSPGVRVVDERTGVQIQGFYDGVCLWLYPDGRIVNRFAEGEWADSNRRRAIDDWITEHGERAWQETYGKKS